MWGFITHTLSLSFPTGVDCSTPKQPNHGTVSYDGTGYNMVVSYKCDEGYSLIGSSKRVCQSNGNWSGEEPVCATVHQHEEFQVLIADEDKISSFHVKSIVAFLFAIFLFCGFCFRGYFLFLFLLVCFIYFKYYFLFFCFVFLFFFLQVLQLLQLLNSLLQLLNSLSQLLDLIYAIAKCLEPFTRRQRR